jgi:hypothetical protein
VLGDLISVRIRAIDDAAVIWTLLLGRSPSPT